VELSSALAAELRTILGRLKRRLREHGGRSDLTPSQVSVLLRLEKDGPATVSSLARAEGMRPQSMSAAITPLVEAGLVSGSPDPNDGRQTLMFLTKTCQKWLQDGRAARQDWLTTMIQQKLSAREQESLSAALELLGRLVED
jgi:DNA-binding MarR family transcriptional regulator